MPHRPEADPVFRREMRERWRRPLTLLQLALFALALGFLGYQFYASFIPQGEVTLEGGTAGAGRGFFYAVARAHLLAWIPIGMMMAAPALAAERERGHLPEWLLAGLRPDAIARAKLSGLAGFVLVMVSLPFPVLALCFPLGGVAPTEFAAMGALTLAVALASVTKGLAISASAARVSDALGAAAGRGIMTLLWAGPLLAMVIAIGPTAMLTVALLIIAIISDNARNAARAFEAEIEGDAAPPIPTYRAAMPLGDSSFAALDALSAGAHWERPRPHARPPSDDPVTAAEPIAGAWARPYSPLETLFLNLAARSPVARRELMMHFNRRDENWFGEWAWTLSPFDTAALWSVLGALVLALDLCFPGWPWLSWASWATLVGAMVAAVLSSAPAFARERAQRTLTELKLTALSPREIVLGKGSAALLSCAHRYAGPLLFSAVLALKIGPRSALMLPILVAGAATLSAAGTLFLSLCSRKTELVSGVALASLAALWLVAPLLLGATNAPLLLRALWLDPLQDFAGATNDAPWATAMARLALTCAAGALLCVILSVSRLRRLGLEAPR